MPRQMEDLTGNKYSRWTVIRFDKSDKSKYYWICKCDCGNIKSVNIDNLKIGKSKSCGCYKKEVWSEIYKRPNKRRFSHGLSKTRFYHIWQSMKQRCTNPFDEAYEKYGLQRIYICDRWLDFNNFVSDMYKAYQEHCELFGEKNTSIDRIDNTKGYYQCNCRWATQKEQMNNTKNSLQYQIIKDIDGKDISKLDAVNKYELTKKELLNYEKGFTLQEIIDKIPKFKQLVYFRNLILKNVDILENLTPRQAVILSKRYNINDYGFHTLKEISEEFGITRERVRQIESKSLESFFGIM